MTISPLWTTQITRQLSWREHQHHSLQTLPKTPNCLQGSFACAALQTRHAHCLLSTHRIKLHWLVFVSSRPRDHEWGNSGKWLCGGFLLTNTPYLSWVNQSVTSAASLHMWRVRRRFGFIEWGSFHSATDSIWAECFSSFVNTKVGKSHSPQAEDW